ncbi:MAG: adenylate/guanylate cyclase domain-containing protein [Fimbriiglobus sp.]
MTTPPNDTLSGRAQSAYIRQELLAPAQALVEYARELESHATKSQDDLTRKDANRLADRAQYLVSEIEKITSGATSDSTDREMWRRIRHDLRGAASFIIMACEEIREASPPEILSLLDVDLDRTLSAARRLIKLIEQFQNSGRNPMMSTVVPADVRAMLAQLPKTIAKTSQQTGLTGRVLLVDDNEFGRDLVERMLRQQGHEVELASTGQAALDRLANPGPPIDLILLDVMMPGLSGPEVLIQLKTNPETRDLPVIMVSALGEDDTVLACIAAGAEDYLTRPVHAELLTARITASLEKKRLRDRINQLVRAIIPAAVVGEWEQTGTIAPKHHEMVGVLFLDVVGFTKFAEQYRNDPAPVIRLLQSLVEKFEITAAKHGVQKIKTIGDAFMGVVGLMGEPTNPALTLLRCGLDFLEDARQHPASWNVRVGIHIGPVVTGILGRTQFSFDVWGHTVNAASRIESNGLPGRVSLSAEAWEMLGDLAQGETREVAARGLGLVSVWDFVGWR